MKKLLLSIFTALLVFVPVASVDAFAQEITLNQNASETMNKFIQVTSAIDSDWAGFTISDVEKIYDANLVEYGYVFELVNSDKEGYGIVLNTNGVYTVVEASKDIKSPFSNYDEDYKNVYVTPLEYYVSPVNTSSMLRSTATVFIDTLNGNTISASDFITTSFDYAPETSQQASQQMLQTNLLRAGDNPRETGTVGGVGYVSNKLENYQYIIPTVQGDKQCIPTSLAMALNYLHGIGKITLKGSYAPSVLKNTLYNLMANSTGFVTANATKTVLQSWTSNRNNCSRTVTTRSDGFQPDTFYSVAQDEIDGNYPLVLMFYANKIGYNVNHATTMVGFQTINDRGVVTNYAQVRDPGQSPCPERMIIWNATNVYGYFILYLN